MLFKCRRLKTEWGYRLKEVPTSKIFLLFYLQPHWIGRLNSSGTSKIIIMARRSLQCIVFIIVVALLIGWAFQSLDVQSENHLPSQNNQVYNFDLSVTIDMNIYYANVKNIGIIAESFGSTGRKAAQNASLLYSRKPAIEEEYSTS